MVEIRHYLTVSGKNVFGEWLNSLRDPKAEARISARIARLTAGNFGDCRPLSEGVWELQNRLGVGLPRLLRNDRPDMRLVVVRR